VFDGRGTINASRDALARSRRRPRVLIVTQPFWRFRWVTGRQNERYRPNLAWTTRGAGTNPFGARVRELKKAVE